MIMKRHMDNRYDNKHYQKKEIQVNLSKAKDIKQFILNNHFMFVIPKEVLSPIKPPTKLYAYTSLKLINIGHNNIEYINPEIKNLINLEVRKNIFWQLLFEGNKGKPMNYWPLTRNLLSMIIRYRMSQSKSVTAQNLRL